MAINFTISDDLPKLGYLTFLDAILICTFVISIAEIVLNVVLKRLDDVGQSEQAARLERLLIVLYPIVYVVAFGLVTYAFLWRQ